MFSGSKFQNRGPIIEKEFLANEAHLNFATIGRFVLFDLRLYRVLFLTILVSRAEAAVYRLFRSDVLESGEEEAVHLVFALGRLRR